MEISEYMGINYETKYTTNELSNLFSKFTNLKMGDYHMDHVITDLLVKQNSLLVIEFINMFKDINEFEHSRDEYHRAYSLAGSILRIIRFLRKKNQVHVYKIMDHLLKLNMDITQMYFIPKQMYGIGRFDHTYYNNGQNHDTVMYMVNNYDVIKNVRKIINNNDIILFDITNDLPIIELILLISKSRHKNLPKFIIIHKIFYYYLLDKNIMSNLS